MPWPPDVPEYGAGHPASAESQSLTSFNWLESAGLRAVRDEHEFRLEDSSFRGDWFLLRYLLHCEDVASRREEVNSDVYGRYREWNSMLLRLRWRKVIVHLERAPLFSMDFRGIRLPDARFDQAILHGCAFDRAHLVKAKLNGTSCGYCSFAEAELVHARLVDADLSHADFRLAKLNGSVLSSAKLCRADLTGADVRGAIGLRFDQNPARDIRIEGNAPDPWSQLRRKYTGPLFFLHSALLVAFILPYVGKVLALTAADQAARQLDSTVLPEARDSAFLVLIGWTEGWWVMGIGLVLLLYNALRLTLTIRVGMLRDAEERSGVTPALGEYMGTQGLDDESVWKGVGIACRDGARCCVSWLRRRIELGAWWVLRGIGAADEAEKNRIEPSITLESVGYWRLHLASRALGWFALLFFLYHAAYWIWNTTVPAFN